MKTHFRKSSKQGFTLVELIVAMAVTTLIITVLVGITSVAIDAWKRSRAEVRASRQGKAMIDSMARDFESMVSRKGNSFEWLYAKAVAQNSMPGEGEQTIKTASSNALDLVFFTAATDRYTWDSANNKTEDGIGSNDDKGGDVSCVGYKLVYQDPLSATGKHGTFALYRKMVDPDDSFASLLGKGVKELKPTFDAASGGVSANANFVCENVYQFTVTFMVEVKRSTGAALMVPVVMGDGQGEELSVLGNGLSFDPTLPPSVQELNNKISTPLTVDELKAGRLAGVQISLTVLTDFGLEQLRTRSFTDDQKGKEAKAKFFSQNSFEYSKLVELSGM